MSFLTKYLPKKKKLELKKVRHIRKDWSMALLVFLGFVILFSISSFFVFLQISNEDDFETQTAINTNQLIDQDLLNKTIIFNEEKERRFNEYQSSGIDAPAL